MADYDWDFRDYEKEARVAVKVRELREQLLDLGYDAVIEEQYLDESAVAIEATCIHCGSMVGLNYLEKHQEFMHPYPKA